MPTGTANVIDVYSDVVLLAGTARGANTGGNNGDGAQRGGSASIPDLYADLLLLPQNDITARRRSPGDLGYAGVPVVGTTLASAIVICPGRTHVAYHPGGPYNAVITSQRIDTGIQSNADSTPVVVAVRNGAIDGSMSLTVTPIGGRTGCYSVSGTFPGSWSKGDSIQMLVQAVVNSITENETVDSFELGGIPVAGQAWP